MFIHTCVGISQPIFYQFIIPLSTAVVGFLGMLVFAAEVKNKASRAIGQEDMTGGGFSGALAGLLLVVIGCCLLGSGREVSQREEIVIDNWLEEDCGGAVPRFCLF